MDELELLKKDWKKQDDKLPKLSYDEIYKMMLKKSSSLVKWIFMISVGEFLILFLLEVIGRVNGAYEMFGEDIIYKNISIVSNVISYSVILFFMVKFYMNYKTIQTTDSAKELMKNILKTRRTVKYYVITNLSILTIALTIAFGYVLFGGGDLQVTKELADTEMSKYAIMTVFFIFIIITIFIAGLIYFLLYGLLTRKLKKNYKELKKMDL
ncbi:hypothetical protein [Aquimarina rhabdastrellae]